MFNISWFELLVIIIISFVVLDVKDLPLIMKKIGKFIHKIKVYSQNFTELLETEKEDFFEEIKEDSLTAKKNKSTKKGLK